MQSCVCSVSRRTLGTPLALARGMDRPLLQGGAPAAVAPQDQAAATGFSRPASPERSHTQSVSLEDVGARSTSPERGAVHASSSDATATAAAAAAADRTEINLIFLIIAFAAIDNSVAIPSLWPYIRDLGGSKLLYGFAGAITNAVQIFSLPFFGWLSDKYSRKDILIVGHVIMVLGGLLYGAAGTIGPGNGALVISAIYFLELSI